MSGVDCELTSRAGAPATLDTRIVQGKSVRAQVEVEGGALVASPVARTARQHRRVESRSVQGKLVRMLEKGR